MGAHSWYDPPYPCWCREIHDEDNPPPRDKCGNPNCGCAGGD